jgi:hypothetical protein
MTVYTCQLCGREFKKKDHLNNHNNKKIPCIKTDKLYEIELIKKELEKYKLENAELKKNENNIEIQLIKQELEKYKLINNELMKEINNLKGTNNFITNNNININNNINFNVVKIIDHGKEDYTKLDIKNLMLNNKYLSKYNYISTIIYYIHCNDDYPEYQNIYISDLSRNKAMIYYDGRWTHANKFLTIDNLFNSIFNSVDEIIENSSNPKKFKNYISEINKISPSGKEFSLKNKKNAIINSEIVLHSNKEKIKSLKYYKQKNTLNS